MGILVKSAKTPSICPFLSQSGKMNRKVCVELGSHSPLPHWEEGVMNRPMTEAFSLSPGFFPGQEETLQPEVRIPPTPGGEGSSSAGMHSGR